jgi:choice-of-anchor A domain-containing protein/uncharacterized repeat protein (TIGR01451 family)/TQXA domain-containing protein
MNKITRLLFRVLFSSLLLLAFSSTYFAQVKGMQSALDHTSSIVLSGTSEGADVTFTYSGHSKTAFAGIITGTLNGQTQKFYCIDILHEVNPSSHPTYTDAGSTPSAITYILNNYYPYNTTSYTNKLSDNNEAAAVQLAIWHYSDNVDASTITNSTIKNRVLAIIADANANNNSVIPLETLIIVPSTQSLVKGTTASVEAYALDLNGNPISNLAVTLSTTLGSLSASSATTDANGKIGPISLTYSGTGTATITAKATLQIPQGTRYIDVADSAGKQKLVLATPTTDLKEVTATVIWYTQTTPGTCDTRGFTTFTQGGWGSPSNSCPGKIRDLYFSTVFPSGLVVGGTYKLTLTSATAVKDYLPDGGTAAAYTQNYTNPTSSISVLSGQLVALKLNVAFSAAGKLGSNSTKLGELVIASGPFVGKTVNQFLALAETAIGGGSLNGFTISQYNTAATAINENFDNGTTDNGFLSCADQVCKEAVGGYLYRDLDVDGTKDSGETALSGVIVELVQGTTVSSTTTDVNGYYSFTNLSNGTYTVRIAASNFVSGGVFYNTDQTKWYTKNSTSVSTTLNCADNLSINFGYYKTCVSITKSADKTSYNSGDVITYTFVVENCGDVQLHGGIDIFDAMLNTSGTHLIKHIDVLDPRQSTTFTMTYTTSDSDCGQLKNTVTAEGHPVDGSAYVTDSSTWTVTVVCQEKGDVKVEKSVSNANPSCNDNVTFTIKVTNLGPNTAKGIEVSDVLPSGLDYVSSSASQGTYSNTTGAWAVGNLNNGAYATLTITVKVNCGQVNNSVFDLGAAKDYNLFVIEDATQPSSDTQGKVAVGNDAKFSTYSVGDQLPANSGDVLVVGRDLTFTSGAVYNGNVVYGHSTNLPQSNVSITGGALRKDNPINFTTAKASLQSLSTTLSTYTVNCTTTFQWGGLTLTGTDPYLNVFSVNGANLSSANNVEINAPNGSSVLVNISGTTITWTGGLVVNGTAMTNVLYNFYQATSIKIQGIDVRGSILAPFAAVNFASGVQNGQMICLSLTGMGQFNYAPFCGYIPIDKKITNVAIISATTTVDPNSENNTSSATINVTNTSTGGNTGGSTGGSNTSWSTVCSFGQGEIVYSLVYASNGYVYAGTWGGKIYKSTDNGSTWTVINSGMNVSFIWSLNISGSYIYAATENGVYKYNGSTWSLTALSGKDVHALVSYNGIIYAGTWGFGIYKSADYGTTWTQVNTGLNAFLSIQSLTVTSSGNIFAGTAGGGVFKSTDGSTWTKLTCGYGVIWSMATTSTAVFAGTYGDGLYRSLDGGSSWTKLTSLNVSFVYSISVNLSGKIYVSSLTNGVFASSDNGTTWSSIGMDGLGVSALMVNTSSNTVYAGTKEGKVFKVTSTEGTTGVEENSEIPTEFKLAQNYPNPFNPSTMIEFAIPQAGKYSLKIYNVLGQEVASLIDNELAIGNHKVNFDATKLASGMYIYNLRGSNVNISKKMILMK